MNKDGLICWNCQKDVPYSVKLRRRIRNINGVELDYMEKYGECDICHSEIMVPGLIDENERNADSLYRAKKDVITIDEIKELLRKYNCDKRPASNILGLGEHTISRYLDGAMPNNKNSVFLRKALSDHKVMRNLLEENRDCITESAYKKIDKELSKMEKACSFKKKIELIALYIIHTSFEVTDLYLQKMLYFVKAFSLALLDKDIVDEACEAWAYGPVFPSIYDKYRSYGKETIPDYDKGINYDDLLSLDEKDIIDYVVKCFGIYNGSVLMKITHMEKPWIDARMGLPDFAPSNNVISDEAIKEYYNGINTKYHIGDVNGVKEYIGKLGVV